MRFAQSLPGVQVIGGALFGALGLLLFISLGGSLQSYLPFALLAFLAIALGLVSVVRSWSELRTSYSLLFTNLVALLIVLFLFPNQKHPFAHALCSALMLVAVVDGSLVMAARPRWICSGVVAISVVLLVAFFPAARDWQILGPLVLLVAWKSLVNLSFGRALEAKLKRNQLEAFQATVVTLNHEFNNVAAVTDGILKKVHHQKMQAVTLEPADVEMLDRNLKRLVQLIKRFRGLKAYEEIEYVGAVKMVELPRD